MRPTLRLLDDGLIERILAEARDLLKSLGVEIHNPALLDLLADHGVRVDRAGARAWLTDAVLDRALESAPSGFKLFDVRGAETHHFCGTNIHFTPGSAAINILDGETWRSSPRRRIRYVKVVSGLPHLASQSTAFIPPTPSRISTVRLFSALYGEKPVVTGASRSRR
jgi:trimethylamine--corrinoid protein Co-methyltransferase